VTAVSFLGGHHHSPSHVQLEASVVTSRSCDVSEAVQQSTCQSAHKPPRQGAQKKPGGNPVGAILSVALLLRYGLRLTEEANAVEAAVETAISRGARTADLGGELGCRAMGDAIVDELLRASTSAHCVHMHWG